MLSLVWFKRDLRVSDHPALAHAAARGPVLPVYIVEPGFWAEPDASGRQYALLAEAIDSLRTDLAALGQPLILRSGEAVEVLARLQAKHGFTGLVSHEETGNAWTHARDRRVAGWARANGIDWVELPQSGVVRRLAGRDGWSRQRDGFVTAPVLPAPALPPVAEASGALPGARALGLAEDRCPNRQRGGRPAALLALEGFLEARGQTYRFAMSSPPTAERACSRLSPHLALGTLSMREVVQATARAREVWSGQRDWTASLRRFEARLAWRDHFMQKLEDQPSIETRALHPAMEGLRGNDPVRLAAWAAGETGLPFVDACMRYLNATGWLNFRMRAMLMAVASYHLWLDWRLTGQHLARQFTDYEPGIHWPQVQMRSGTTGINALRIYNPVKQGHDQDPQGAFVRRWLPELAPVPDAFVHEPWRWPLARQVLAGRYPEPLVDPGQAARDARLALAGARKVDGFRMISAAVAVKHASRKGATRGTTRPRDSAQMSLDL